MMKCWYCGAELIWKNDFTYEEVYGEGEGFVTYLSCSNKECKSEVQISKRNDKEN